MNIEEVVRVVEQSVSGVRVKVLNHRYAELEELKVVFDCASPIPEFCDKVTGLMEKARFHNTHAYVNDDGDFTMIFARATSFGVEILEREAKRSRDELNLKALERLVKQGKATIKLERGNCRMKKRPKSLGCPQMIFGARMRSRLLKSYSTRQ